MNWLYLGIAAAAGAIMALQGTLNSLLGKFVGQLEGNFIVHAIGLAVISAMLFVFGMGKGQLSDIVHAPWYSYLGGVLNVGIIYGVMVSIAKTGAANATAAIIVGQVGTAMLLDLFGLFGLEKAPWSWWRLIGLILLTVGGRLMLQK